MAFQFSRSYIVDFMEDPHWIQEQRNRKRCIVLFVLAPPKFIVNNPASFIKKMKFNRNIGIEDTWLKRIKLSDN